MITNIRVAKFSSPVQVFPGDKLIVNHVVKDGDRTIETRVVQQEITVSGVWTHSIMFELNGQPNHVIGNEQTVAWIESQAA